MRTLRQSQGFTLIEILVVTAIIAFTASVAIPDFTLSESYQQEAAAIDIAQAFRFARSESVRTGTHHGVDYDSNAKTFKVFWLNTSTLPASVVYDVYHPVKKQLYWLDFATEPRSQYGLTINKWRFGGNTADRSRVIFDEWGTPYYINSSTIEMLDLLHITLLSPNKFTLEVHPMVGWVSVK